MSISSRNDIYIEQSSIPTFESDIVEIKKDTYIYNNSDTEDLNINKNTDTEDSYNIYENGYLISGWLLELCSDFNIVKSLSHIKQPMGWYYVRDFIKILNTLDVSIFYVYV